MNGNGSNGNGRVKSAVVALSLVLSTAALIKDTVFSSGREMGSIEQHLTFDDQRLDRQDARLDRDEERLEPVVAEMEQIRASEQERINEQQNFINELRAAIGRKP